MGLMVRGTYLGAREVKGGEGDRAYRYDRGRVFDGWDVHDFRWPDQGRRPERGDQIIVEVDSRAYVGRTGAAAQSYTATDWEHDERALAGQAADK